MYYFRVMCIGDGCHPANGSERSTLPSPRPVILPTSQGIWGSQQGTLCFCQRNGVASFWEDGLWEVLPQSTSLMCETELKALIWVAHSLLLGLCLFPVCGQVELFQLFSKEVLFYVWRNLMFLIQQRNLSCSVTIQKTVGEALSDIIHPREVSCSYIEKSIY